MKDPRRQWQGAVNRAQGRIFEESIAASLRYYELGHAAKINKTPESMKVLKPLESGRFEACFDKKAQPDFKGVIRGGRCVCFEAKHTVTGKLQQSCVNSIQTDELNAYHELGAMCFVLAGFGRDDVYRIPWTIWREMKAYLGHKYCTPEELDIYKIQRNDKGTLLIFSKTKGEIENG